MAEPLVDVLKKAIRFEPDAPIVRTYRELHEAGLPLQTIADRFETNVATVSKIGIELGLRRKPNLSNDQREQIRVLADAFPIREIARRVGCSVSQAGHWVLSWREREAGRCGEIAPRRLNTPRKCPKHGRLVIWPCVACAAEANIDERRSSHELLC